MPDQVLPMKIAIFHDYFNAIGGGERVVVELARILDADIITTDPDVTELLNKNIRVKSLGITPKIPALKQISASKKFYLADYSKDYDFFIFTGNWSRSAARHHHPNLWYCFTPVRAFYDLYETFLHRQNFISRQLFRLWTTGQRVLDQYTVSNLDRIATISGTVHERVKKYYERDSEIIYPPVDVSRYRCENFGEFWLSVNRLYPEKRIDLQIDCFRRMPEEQLIIVGGFAYGDHAANYALNLSKDLPENVKILGEIPEKELIKLYSNCKGHICTAMDEDFGLTPLEAMASGKAVVAVNEGGYCETITDYTGILVDPCIEQITRAVKVVSANPGKYREACIKRASEFDLPVFAEKIKKIIYTDI